MNKVSNNIKKGFDSKPVYNEKYLQTKAKFYEGRINTNFHDNGLHKGSYCIYSSLILTDFLFEMGKDYYSQLLL